ncbi:HAD family hydrolase [Nostoc sp. DedVER01b]|uniref:HAD family hydrolase n=1 Tax=Nostoc sp. DedVER01b TaxID=3075404 RepID=UPI002AD29B0A|nr:MULTISPECIES: HAD family hydrolase [unclassified Nostoc]MDZ7984661.1 HAD family hydrolase [Nostoc sp. DedVER02]MDZ8115544.1 HAD family hydrolase [Nostoc sp. DedVER01b]
MKYLFWDFDNTLGYRQGMWSETLHSILILNVIYNIDLEDIRPFLKNIFPWHSPETPHSLLFNGKTWWEYMNEYFAQIYERVGINRNQAIKYAFQVQNEYKNIEKWYLYDDVVPTLQYTIKNNYKNIILSNHIPELHEIIDELNITKYFEQIYTSGKIGHEKPSLKFYTHVINDLKIEKTECIMIGDSYNADITGALRVGIQAILVRKPNDKNYKFYSPDFSEILKIIRTVSTMEESIFMS